MVKGFGFACAAEESSLLGHQPARPPDVQFEVWGFKDQLFPWMFRYQRGQLALPRGGNVPVDPGSSLVLECSGRYMAAPGAAPTARSLFSASGFNIAPPTPSVISQTRVQESLQGGSLARLLRNSKPLAGSLVLSRPQKACPILVPIGRCPASSGCQCRVRFPAEAQAVRKELCLSPLSPAALEVAQIEEKA